jgi:hypothetical protein
VKLLLCFTIYCSMPEYRVLDDFPTRSLFFFLSFSFSLKPTRILSCQLWFGYIYLEFPFKLESWDSSVSIVTGYWLDGLGLIRGSVRCISSLQCPDQLWGPPSLPSNGYRDSFPRGKMVRAWSWPLTPSSVEVKKGEAILPLPHDFLA